MARSKISIAHKNLTLKLLAHCQTAANAATHLVAYGEMTKEFCAQVENSALDLIGALREYQRESKVLFTQGQKS